jgi:hypothetical protein
LDITRSDANQQAGTYQPQPQRSFEDEIQYASKYFTLLSKLKIMTEIRPNSACII